MKKTVFFFCLLIFGPVLAEDQKAFVYDANSKRDPFGPLVSPSGTLITYGSDISIADMVLEGVMSDAQGNNLAIINGKIVKSGDQVGAYMVSFITNDYVELIKGQERLKLSIKKGGV